MRAAKALGIASLIAALDKSRRRAWRAGQGIRGFEYALLRNPDKRPSSVPSGWGARCSSLDPIFVAAGAIAVHQGLPEHVVGGTLCWAVFVPVLQSQGVITGSSYRDIVQWTLWGGARLHGHFGSRFLAFQWRTALRAVTDLVDVRRAQGGCAERSGQTGNAQQSFSAGNSSR